MIYVANVPTYHNYIAHYLVWHEVKCLTNIHVDLAFWLVVVVVMPQNDINDVKSSPHDRKVEDSLGISITLLERSKGIKWNTTCTANVWIISMAFDFILSSSTINILLLEEFHLQLLPIVWRTLVLNSPQNVNVALKIVVVFKTSDT